jgi:hypothetical protein
MGTQSGQISGQSLHSVERRKHLRYQLDFPAIFSWESSQRSRLQGEGITRDIGPFGAFEVVRRNNRSRCQRAAFERRHIQEHATPRDAVPPDMRRAKST